MMYKTFVDESGKKEYFTPYSKDFIDNPPSFDQYENFWWNNYFVLCGIRVKHEDIGEINTEINKLKNKYFKTHNVEIKSDWMRNPHQRKKRYLDKFKITVDKLNEFGEKFVDLISLNKEKLKILAVVFDKRYYGNRKRTTAEGTPLLKTTQVLLERREWAGELKTKHGKSRLNLYPYFNRIRCNFFYNPANLQVRGCGLICIPDKNKVNWNLLKGCGIKKAPLK